MIHNNNTLTNPAKGSAMGPRGLAATNLAALLLPVGFWSEVMVNCGSVADQRTAIKMKVSRCSSPLASISILATNARQFFLYFFWREKQRCKYYCIDLLMTEYNYSCIILSMHEMVNWRIHICTVRIRMLINCRYSTTAKNQKRILPHASELARSTGDNRLP